MANVDVRDGGGIDGWRGRFLEAEPTGINLDGGGIVGGCGVNASVVTGWTDGGGINGWRGAASMANVDVRDGGGIDGWRGANGCGTSAPYRP